MHPVWAQACLTPSLAALAAQVPDASAAPPARPRLERSSSRRAGSRRHGNVDSGYAAYQARLPTANEQGLDDERGRRLPPLVRPLVCDGAHRRVADAPPRLRPRRRVTMGAVFVCDISATPLYSLSQKM